MHGKSYAPINGKGVKGKPGWISDESTQMVQDMRTDDAEFGPGYMQSVPAQEATEGQAGTEAVTHYANFKNGKWFPVTVQSHRIINFTPTKKLPF